MANDESQPAKAPGVKDTYYITLLRHAESMSNMQKIVPGHLDDPLTEKGRTQAQALAQRWQAEDATFDLAIVSPLMRTSQTAEIITTALDIPVEFNPLWVERNTEKISGMSEADAWAMYVQKGFTNPYQILAETGEGDWQLYLRAGQALFDLLQRPPGRYLIVSHSEMLNMTIYAMLGITPSSNFQGPRFRFENAAFSQFRYHPKRHHWQVDVIGDQTHCKSSE